MCARTCTRTEYPAMKVTLRYCSKPPEHMERMLNLLGEEEPNFLFIELFLRHMPPHVQTALANTAITEPRALAEEADRFFLATQHFTPDVFAPTRSYTPPSSSVVNRRDSRAADDHATRACAISTHALAPRQRGAAPRATTTRRETTRPALCSSRERGHD